MDVVEGDVLEVPLQNVNALNPICQQGRVKLGEPLDPIYGTFRVFKDL